MAPAFMARVRSVGGDALLHLQPVEAWKTDVIVCDHARRTES
jgi:hypothetical protein